jgi:hypothetical protein
MEKSNLTRPKYSYGFWSKPNILSDLAPSSLLSFKGSLGTLDERTASSFHQPRISGR